MRHPALTRALAVFLAVFSVLTLISGAWSIRKAEKEKSETARRTEVLTGQIERALELSRSVESGREEAEALAAELPDFSENYRSEANAYRGDLNQYTLTKAGLQIGRVAVAQAAAALVQGREQLEAGSALVQSALAAIEPMYALCLQARSDLDAGWNTWQEGINRLSLEEEDPEHILQPDQALALVGAARGGLTVVGDLAQSALDQTSEDQSQTAQSLMEALATLQMVESVSSGDVTGLSYRYAESLYEQANALAAAQIAAGRSEEEAYAEADAFVRENIGIGYAELEAWLRANEGAASSSSYALPAFDLTEEQSALLFQYLPSDRELLQQTISLLQESDRDLAAEEQQIRADPEALNASELLLSLLRIQLESSERVMELIEPQILEAKQQLDELAAQMEAAAQLLNEADKGVQQGWYTLYQTEQGLLETEAELKERKAVLEADYRTLLDMQERSEAYEELSDRYASARAHLMSDEEIAARADAGEDLIEAAQDVREERSLRADETCRVRLRISLLMLIAAAFGFAAVLCAFEKLPIRRFWTLLVPTILLGAAGEAWSCMLGRGLWYTTLFLILAALALLPLSFGKRRT